MFYPVASNSGANDRGRFGADPHERYSLENKTMGQAKNRGSFQDRVEAAKAKMDALRPESITCNNCQHAISDVFPLDSRGMSGIDAAFGGLCPECGQSTYAIKGSEDAVEKLMMVMEEVAGEAPLIGTTRTRP